MDRYLLSSISGRSPQKMGRSGRQAPLRLIHRAEYPAPPPPLEKQIDERLFSLDQRAALRGNHPRRSRPAPLRRYVAGVAMRAEQPLSVRTKRLLGTQGEHGVVTIADADPHDPGRAIHIVDHCRIPLEPDGGALNALRELLWEHWGCSRAAVSCARGTWVLGLRRLEAGPGTTETVGQVMSLSGQGAQLREGAGLGRLKMYEDDQSPESREFWAQIVRARYKQDNAATPEVYVEPSSAGDSFLRSLGLAVIAASSAPDIVPVPQPAAA